MNKKVYKKTLNHFKEVESYKSRKGSVRPEDSIIVNFIKEACTTNSQVLEVGGGSGYMLDLIASETGINHLYNCEIVPETYKRQMHNDINLIGGNVLSLPFNSGIFDFVIIIDLLHHLVDTTRSRSKENARKAIKELIRVTKDKGYVIVLEQYNSYRFFSAIIFYLTLLLSNFNIRIQSLYLSKKAIVSFFNPEEIMSLLAESGGTELILTKDRRFKVNRRLKLTFLMSNSGSLLAIVKVKTQI